MEIIEIMFRYWPWPIVFLIFIIMFREPIFEFLKRLKTLKIFSAVLETGIPPEQKKEEITKSLPPEKEIIKDVGEEDRKIITKKYPELLEKYTFELTLNAIYGTQMDLLEFLSKKGTLGEKYSDLKRFYYYFIGRSKLAVTRTETQYFGFLKDMGFIEYVGEGEERIVTITPDGLNFLSYVKKRYPATYRDRSGMKF